MSGKMVQRKCRNRSCGKTFMARSADVKRGWGRFCCKSCKASDQEGRTHQFAKFLDGGGTVGQEEEIGHIYEDGYFGHGQE